MLSNFQHYLSGTHCHRQYWSVTHCLFINIELKLLYSLRLLLNTDPTCHQCLYEVTTVWYYINFIIINFFTRELLKCSGSRKHQVSVILLGIYMHVSVCVCVRCMFMYIEDKVNHTSQRKQSTWKSLSMETTRTVSSEPYKLSSPHVCDG